MSNRQIAIDFHAAAGYRGVRRLLVCGSRTLRRDHLPLIREELVCVPKNTVVVHGAQGVLGEIGPGVLRYVSGADMLADEVARELGLEVEQHPAKWRRADGSLDRGAGPARNEAMVASGVDFCLAFWDGKSPGTMDTMRRCRSRGIPVKIVEFSA